MKELQEYVTRHALRGECRCGRCAERVSNPEQKQPQGHTADMIFFKVAACDNADAEKLRELIKANGAGCHTDVELFDGREHNYMELGGWIGDQGMALMLMGLGTVLGLWDLLTPVTMLNLPSDDERTKMFAGMGMIAIQAKGAK
jgi:hypothetical protein